MNNQPTKIEQARQIISDLMDRGFVVAVIKSRLHVRPAHKLTDRGRFALKVYQRQIFEYWRELQETAGIKPEANDSQIDLGSPAITHFKPERIRWQPVLYPPTH